MDVKLEDSFNEENNLEMDDRPINENTVQPIKAEVHKPLQKPVVHI
jgi:hypothetical protein